MYGKRARATIHNRYTLADSRMSSSEHLPITSTVLYHLQASQMADNQEQRKNAKSNEKVWLQRSSEKQRVVLKRLILIVVGREQTSFKCCGKIYEGQKTCLVSRYRYQKEMKQIGTDIITASIDPRRTITTTHTGVIPAKTQRKIH